MATAPIITNLSRWNFELNDTDEILIKDAGRNADIDEFSQSLTVMTNSINTDLQTMEGQKTATQQAATAASADAEQVATDRQAVASDRTHVDQQKGIVDTKTQEVSNNAQQVATDRQAVSADRLASEQAAGASSDAATASIQAKDEAEALYSDLNAIETAKTQSQQAATDAGEERGLAQTAREGAEAAQETAETAAGISQQAADTAVTNHVAKEDPHAQYQKKEGLKAGAFREVVGGSGKLLAEQAYGFATTAGGMALSDNDADNALLSAFYKTDENTANMPPEVQGGQSARGTLYVGAGINTNTTTAFLICSHSGYVGIRRRNGGGWGNWDRVFSRTSILGAVSQSGGVPTGAILQRGSNDDGEFVIYADGTVDMYINEFSLTTILDSGSNKALYNTWDLPVSFTPGPGFSVSPTLRGGGGSGVNSIGGSAGFGSSDIRYATTFNRSSLANIGIGVYINPTASLTPGDKVAVDVRATGKVF